MDSRRRSNPRQFLLLKQLLVKPKGSSNIFESGTKVFGIGLACATLILTFNTYSNTEKWKKAEFSVSQFRKFQDNKSVQLANQILDYDRKSLPLLKADSLVVVDERLVAHGLLVDTIKPTFNDEESRYREIFDEYLDELALFNRYYKEQVVDSAVLKPFLRYQIREIADTTFRKNSQSLRKLQLTLWNYIDYYQFQDVQELCLMFGFNISLKKDQTNANRIRSAKTQ